MLDVDAASQASGDEEYLISRLVRRLRPREGWHVLLLGLVAVGTLPASAIEGRLVPGLEPVLLLSSLGFLCSWWFAHRRLPGWGAAIVMAALGVLADLIWGVHALAFWPLVRQSATWLIWLVGKRAISAPAVTYFGDQWASLATFARRVSWWLAGVFSGQGVADNLVLIGVAGLLAWGVAAWTGWWLVRRGQPFVALLPTGLLLAQLVFYLDQGVHWLVIYLGSMVLLLGLARLELLMQRWDAAGVDYSPEIRLEVAMVGVAIAGLVMVLAPFLPLPSLRTVSDAFWRVFREPYQSFEDRLEQSFPGVRPGRSLVPASGVAAGGLPRAHLLGGRPELREEVALRVRVRGALPGERLYWRGQTFARYNGHGWENEPAALDQGFAAGMPWTDEPAMAARHPVLSAVEVVAATRAVVYAAGEPISVDRPYHAVQRAPGDLIALRLPDAATRYTVLAEVTTATPEQLRAAPTTYPRAISELYLELPEELPAELAALAAEITRGAQTPYERALAIEAALRQIPYSLDVPIPPPDREVVSWFLFELRRGYCDYFATAMVVLSRLNGIPARLAVGYAQGSYDGRGDLYTVTEMDAHSWPELYFPEYGWIPFEPTPAQVLPGRENLPWPMAGLYPEEEAGGVSLDAGLAELRHLAAVQAAQTARLATTQRLLVLVNGLLLCWFAMRLMGWPLRWGLPDVAQGAGYWFAVLARWGQRLGRPLQPTDTPREYAVALADIAEELVARSQRLSPAAEVVKADAMELAQAYEALVYGDGTHVAQLTESDRRSWKRLWAALRRLWLRRWLII